MIDDISAVQSRISEIQSRIAELTANNTPPATEPSPTEAPATSADANRNFEQALASQRARYGTVSAPSTSDGPMPTPMMEPATALPIGRRPIDLPGRPALAPGAAPSGPLTPFVPNMQNIVPIKTGSASDYQPIIDRYAAANGVPPSLVKAVIRTESDFNPKCVSKAGAMGLMQLMPDNVREAGIDNPYDPEQNIAAGTKQLADLLHQYHGDLDLALAGYNAGPGNVRKYGGVPPFRETQNYIKRVRAAMTDE